MKQTQSTELATTPQPKASALANMASRISVDPQKLLATLKSTVFKGASDDELLALVITANEYQLNPILKEMYAFPQKGGGIVPVVGIDGWLKIINRQPNFNGMETTFSEDGSSATTTIHLKDRDHPVVVSEFLDECKRNTEPWKTMPRRMLRHKSIMQSARVAFGIGGIFDEDEGRDVAMRNVTPNRKVEIREEPFDPAKESVEDDQPQDEPAIVDPNPSKTPAQGRQKKDRYHRDAVYLGITKESSKGKTWWNVMMEIKGKVVEMTTFSETYAENFSGLDEGEQLSITFTKSATGYALEDYKIGTGKGELV